MSDNGSVAAATWEQVELARHPDRPYALDYIHAIFGDFFELHGDRVFGDDHAIIGGPAALDKRTVMVIAQQKGRTTAERAMAALSLRLAVRRKLSWVLVSDRCIQNS